MKFHPRPENDFRRFFATYHSECSKLFPRIRAVCAKWRFEDLIPGLSDFDTRFIVDNGMTADAWTEMSLAVGRVHTELTLAEPAWARILEHLPGLNLTVDEFTDPDLYYPEFPQWTIYEGDADAIAKMQSYLAARTWTRRDELFHLKKVATYFGPYQRGIDPAVNMGPWENKYPLHSRFMHYFTPPVQSMVSLALKRTVTGKIESLRLARELFPDAAMIDLIFDRVERHYETHEDYEEPALAQLETRLDAYLHRAWGTLADKLTLVKVDGDDDRKAIGAKVAAVPVDTMEAYFEGVRFSRLMKGRLIFYAQRIEWFDSAWLVRNELGRIVSNFHDKPLSLYGQTRFGSKLPPAEVLTRLRGNLLTEEQADGMAAFARIASTPMAPGSEKQQALRVAECYDLVLSTLETLSEDHLRLIRR